MNLKNLLSEFRRRNVFKVATVYAIVGWLLIQISDTVFPRLNFPDWTITFIIIMVAIGFPIALIFAWSFELTPDGIKKSEEVTPDKSITTETGIKLKHTIYAVLVLGLGYFIWESRFSRTQTTQSEVSVNSNVTEKLEISIAVLPFADLSEKGDQEWFSDGLTEEILNSLARLPELKVIARTSSFEFKGENKDIKAIAEKLGVDNIVEGSVRRIGDQLRLTAQLIRASDGFHLWSQTYNRTTNDLFEVQEDVAEKIASALDIYLDDERRDAMFETGTRNVEAFEAYLKGKQIFRDVHQRTSELTLWDGNVYFEKAMLLDNEFAQPAMNHMDAYSHVLIDGVSGRVVNDTNSVSREEARIGLFADLDFAIKHANNPNVSAVAKINRAFFALNWDRLPQLISDLENNDDYGNLNNDELIWLPEILLMTRHYDLLYSITEKSIVTDPMFTDSWRTLIEINIASGNYEKALDLIDQGDNNFTDDVFFRSKLTIFLLERNKEEVINLLHTRNNNSDFFKAYIEILDGNIVQAKESIERIEIPDDNYRSKFSLLYLYNEMGDTTNSRKIVQNIDSLPIGPAILGIFSFRTGNTILFDLDDTPFFKSKLQEAGVDVSQFKLLPSFSMEDEVSMTEK